MADTSFGHAVLYFSPNVQARRVQLQLGRAAGRAGWVWDGVWVTYVSQLRQTKAALGTPACIATNVFTHGRQHCSLPYQLLQAAQGLGATILVVLDIFKGAL